MTTAILPDDLVARVSAFATATFGLRFPPDRWGELVRGVASAALELGISDVEAWATTLVLAGVPPAQLQTLANHLTISETYFFRHREFFSPLGESILAERLVAARSQARPLRIWCAGCASGEEPYSLAIFFQRLALTAGPGSIVIIGTDVNSHSLARAERGVYSEWSFRDTPAWVKDMGFARLPNGRLEIRDEIRRRVRFARLNLATPIYPAEFSQGAGFDAIFCRNVLMYFSADWQRLVLRRLRAGLAPGGWLVVGPCDMTQAQSAGLGLVPKTPGVFQALHSEAHRAAVGEHDESNEWAGARAPGGSDRDSIRAEGWDVERVGPNALRRSHSEPAAWGQAAPPSNPEPLEREPKGETKEPISAELHADRGELTRALADCDAAIMRDRVNPDLHYLRACILAEQGDDEEAEAALRGVLLLDPDRVMAHFSLANLARRAGRPEQARHHYTIVLRLLASYTRGAAVAGAGGLTAGRLIELAARNLAVEAAGI